MKEYYKSRIKAIFTYTSGRWHYVLFKTLCVIAGAPLFFALFPLDLLMFLIYAAFSWVPVLKTVLLVLCRALSFVFGAGYYISVLPDAKKYAALCRARREAELEAESGREENVEKEETYDA